MSAVAASRHHSQVATAVAVGVSVVAAIFIVAAIVWIWKGKFARKSQPLHRRLSTTDVELDSVIMSYFQLHDPPVQLPKPPPRVFDPGSSFLTSPHSKSGSHPDRFDRSGHPGTFEPKNPGFTSPSDTEPLQTSSTSPSLAVFVPENTVWELESTMSLASPLDQLHTRTHVQRFQRYERHEPVQVNGVGEEAKMMDARPSHIASRALPTPPRPKQSSLYLPSPPVTPTNSAHEMISDESDHETDLFEFPLPPPSPAGSTFTIFARFRRTSVIRAVTQENSDEKIWSDIFSLEEYWPEDQFIRPRSSVSIREQLPSPPPTPTVLFTPPSPPTTLPAAVCSPQKLDEERLHVWGPSITPFQRDDEEPKKTHNNEGDDSADLRGGLTALALAHDAKAVQARYNTRAEIVSKVKLESSIRQDSPPSYQSLGFEYKSRLAHKRACSPLANTPPQGKTAPHNFIDKVSAIVRPRPPLAEFEPLLCRNVDASKLHTRQATLGVSRHATLSDASNLQDPISVRGPPAVKQMSETPKECEENCLDEETIMGLAL